MKEDLYMKIINRFDISRNWKRFSKETRIRKINSFKDKKEIESLWDYYYDKIIDTSIIQIGNTMTVHGFSELNEKQIGKLKLDLSILIKNLLKDYPSTMDKDVIVTVIPRLPYIKNKHRYTININSSFMVYNPVINKNIVCIDIDAESVLFRRR